MIDVRVGRWLWWRGVHILRDWAGGIRWGVVAAFDGCSQMGSRLVGESSLRHRSVGESS